MKKSEAFWSAILLVLLTGAALLTFGSPDGRYYGVGCWAFCILLWKVKGFRWFVGSAVSITIGLLIIYYVKLRYSDPVTAFAIRQFGPINMNTLLPIAGIAGLVLGWMFGISFGKTKLQNVGAIVLTIGVFVNIYAGHITGSNFDPMSDKDAPMANVKLAYENGEISTVRGLLAKANVHPVNGTELATVDVPMELRGRPEYKKRVDQLALVGVKSMAHGVVNASIDDKRTAFFLTMGGLTLLIALTGVTVAVMKHPGWAFCLFALALWPGELFTTWLMLG